MAVKKGGLGKGLDIIFSENTVEENSGTILKIADIEPNKSQPRKEFDQEALRELADSIAEHGLIQPILVRPIFAGGYEIVAGERRWRASRMAGLKEVPVLIREMDDKEFLEIALIENLQREDLNPVEEAMGYRDLMEKYSLSQEDVAKTVGKSRSAVANTLRLLALPEKIMKMLEIGEITAGHARTLLGFKNQEDMEKVAELAKEGMSVRELEKLQKNANKEQQDKPVKIVSKNQYFVEAELALNSYLGRKIKIDGNSKKGTIQIEFYGEEDLKEILNGFGKGD